MNKQLNFWARIKLALRTFISQKAIDELCNDYFYRGRNEFLEQLNGLQNKVIPLVEQIVLDKTREYTLAVGKPNTNDVIATYPIKFIGCDPYCLDKDFVSPPLEIYMEHWNAENLEKKIRCLSASKNSIERIGIDVAHEFAQYLIENNFLHMDIEYDHKKNNYLLVFCLKTFKKN